MIYFSSAVRLAAFEPKIHLFVFVGFNFTSNMGELDTQTLAQYMHETVNHFLCIHFLIIIFACLEKGKSFYMIPQSLQGKWAQVSHTCTLAGKLDGCAVHTELCRHSGSCGRCTKTVC